MPSEILTDTTKLFVLRVKVLNKDKPDYFVFQNLVDKKKRKYIKSGEEAWLVKGNSYEGMGKVFFIAGKLPVNNFEIGEFTIFKEPVPIPTPLV